jgi:hypothetical protein
MIGHMSGIPKDLADAFSEALRAFAEWKLGDCEPVMLFQSQPTRISDVFNPEDGVCMILGE